MLRLILLLALLVPAWFAGSAPPLRAPLGKWNVDFDDAQCLAIRDYGTTEDPIRLVLKPPVIGPAVQVRILRKQRPTVAAAAQIDARIAIDSLPPFKASMLTFTPKGSEYRVYTMNLTAAQFALVRQAKELGLQSGRLDERLPLSHMTPLMKIVDDCVSNLRRVFNISDPETGNASLLKRRATADLGRIFKHSDYPFEALEREQSGTVAFALLIDENGRVADCTIAETSGVAALDAQSCIILRRRARFEPALGSDGKPAKDAVVARIVWRIRG